MNEEPVVDLILIQLSPEQRDRWSTSPTPAGCGRRRSRQYPGGRSNPWRTECLRRRYFR
ncbi:hypothetical protein ACH4TM_12520 [Streptomyces parvus]|uniref:hypothetical protein n=1 Tax=Streptomyces parvus TaxID=66428 RepID=UPI0033185B7E